MYIYIYIYIYIYPCMSTHVRCIRTHVVAHARALARAARDDDEVELAPVHDVRLHLDEPCQRARVRACAGGGDACEVCLPAICVCPVLVGKCWEGGGARERGSDGAREREGEGERRACACACARSLLWSVAPSGLPHDCTHLGSRGSPTHSSPRRET